MPKIYYVPSFRPGRSYKLILQGLINHPRVELVFSEEEADFIFMHSQSEKRQYDPNKLVVIDFEDPPNYYISCNYKAYFKRSWVSSDRTSIQSYPLNCYPTAYAVMDEFVSDKDHGRTVVFGCCLRPTDEYRKKVLQVAEKIIAPRSYVGEITESKRDVYDQGYLSTLRKTLILLTCNPANWEGDSRTWEALASGCLVFVDRLYTPYKHPLEDGKHCIFYDRDKLDELEEKISYYVQHTDQARKIGQTGREFVMKYHRTVNRIDEILNVLEV